MIPLSAFKIKQLYNHQKYAVMDLAIPLPGDFWYPSTPLENEIFERVKDHPIDVITFQHLVLLAVFAARDRDLDGRPKKGAITAISWLRVDFKLVFARAFRDILNQEYSPQYLFKEAMNDKAFCQRIEYELYHGYMRLGVIEFIAMNNPIRRWIQKHVEFRLFKKHLEKQCIDLKGAVIMDAGCGSGYSTELLANEYHPSRLIAFDYMPEQISLAQKRRIDVDFAVGDLRKVQSGDATCDAVFIFGVIHHIAQWREALYEVARVLKPGGVLLLDEPKYGFTWEELESELRNVGFDILDTSSFFFKLFHTYLCQKPPNQPVEEAG